VQINKMSDERRYYLRINTHLSAEMVNRNGESMGATITDLSVGGLTLEVDAIIAKHIEVIDANSDEPYFPVEASVVFTLPLNNTLPRIEVPCRLVHKRRLSQNTFKMGMMILVINEGQREQLARYVDVAGNP
jgi:c-di-GMP-binding flagellar brake protein YcgR